MITTSEMMMNSDFMLSSSREVLLRKAQGLFNSLRWQASLSRRLAWLTRRCNGLKPLSSSFQKAHYLGTRTIAIEQIHGSESRSDDFDSSFRPLSSRTMQRWTSIAIARQKGVPLPPVELIKVGNEYFVRDGHHRVSVARAFGEQFIEAEIIEW
jgi:hypothetical protein